MTTKLKTLIFLFLTLDMLMVSAYLFLPSYFQSLDNRVRDFYFKARGAEKTDDSIVIIDIDEKSIKELGQWPWERDKIAQILQNLANNGAGIIGLDIVFAEADKTSPLKVAKKWHLNTKNLPDYDSVFANTIAITPTILGCVFDFDSQEHQNKAPQIPAIFIEKNKKYGEFLPQAKGVLTNLAIIQNAGYSSGFMNNIPDATGIIRSVPSMIQYKESIYPSLAFEMYRIASNTQKITLSYSPAGIESIKVGKKLIHSDRFGRIYLNFKGAFKSYKYISAIDVYNNTIKTKDIRGKFVLIGTSAYGLMDLRATPMDNVIAGVELHANLIDNLVHNDMLIRPTWSEIADITILTLILFIVIFGFSKLSLFYLLFAFISMLSTLIYANYYLLFTQHIIVNSLFPILSSFLALTSILGVNFLFEFRQKEMIKGKFASKVSTEVMNEILKNPDNNKLDGEEREITVFFSDIRGFTNISESMGNAQALIKFMNEIMDPMTEIIIKEKGTIDKYIGDAIMAYWNAPLSVKNHADKAVIASLKQLHLLKSLNNKLKMNPEFSNVTKMADKANIPLVDIGIGLNSGVAIVGEMGSLKRSDYTAIGDPINLGARLESLCKYYNSRLNISHFTKEKLKGKYIFRFLDLVTVKGKSEPVAIWQIHDFDDASETVLFYASKKELHKELKLYHQAIKLYKNQNFLEALVLFKDINRWENKSNLHIYDIYIQRCEHYIEVPPQNFNGVFVHTTKG